MPSKKYTSVDQYIADFPKEAQERMQKIREIVKKEASEADEIIGYNMPGYKLNGALVYFAAYAKHIGFYPIPSGVKEFEEEFKNYKTGKGSIQFPLDEPMPYELIRRIVKFRVEENKKKKYSSPRN